MIKEFIENKKALLIFNSLFIYLFYCYGILMSFFVFWSYIVFAILYKNREKLYRLGKARFYWYGFLMIIPIYLNIFRLVEMPNNIEYYNIQYIFRSWGWFTEEITIFIAYAKKLNISGCIYTFQNIFSILDMKILGYTFGFWYGTFLGTLMYIVMIESKKKMLRISEYQKFKITNIDLQKENLKIKKRFQIAFSFLLFLLSGWALIIYVLRFFIKKRKTPYFLNCFDQAIFLFCFIDILIIESLILPLKYLGDLVTLCSYMVALNIFFFPYTYLYLFVYFFGYSSKIDTEMIEYSFAYFPILMIGILVARLAERDENYENL